MSEAARQQIVEVPNAALTPMAMLDRALTSGASAETLEKLMTLQERWQAAQAKRAFDEAIAAAKAEFPVFTKDKQVSFKNRGGDQTDYKHETMPGLAKLLEPILNRNKLSYRYNSKVEAGQIAVTCIISHVEGHREETTLQSAPDASGGKNSVQAIGSAATYLQRYTLKLALGISASDDDDGMGGNPDMAMTITADQFVELRDLLEESGSNEKAMLEYVKAETVETMNLAQYAKAKATMVFKINSKKQKAVK